MTEFTVTSKASRPAGTPEECFYCHRKIGEIHKPECVLLKRTVKVRLTVEYDIHVPADWTKEDIEFHRNESSWCSGNVIEELEKIGGENECLCPHTHFEYLAESGPAFLDE